MAGSLTTKHKAFLILLSIFLILTIISRITYSKHFHGLMCAARTFHEIASSDTGVYVEHNVEPGKEVDEVQTVVDEPKEDVADKVTKLRNSLRKELDKEQKYALENGLYDRRLMKQMKKKKKNPLGDSDRTQVLPQAIIIGVRKCGTRALLEMLEMHPQIAACGPEVHFFDKYYDRGLQWYRQKMKPSIAGQITIEKTPSYYITEMAPERVYSMDKNTKLLVIVRDPTTRVISDFTQIASKGVSKLSSSTFEETVIENDKVRTSYKAVQISMYVNHVERWLKYFPLSQMIFVDGDKLVTDPLSEIKPVEKFLGLSDFLSADKFYYNATSGFYCLAGELNSKCLSASKGREHPNVSADVIKKLQDFFRPYNQRFFQIINRTFDWP